jgi:hypothetical protein
MTHKLMSEKDCLESFRAYEKTIEKQVKSGEIEKHQARLYLSQAKDSYRKQNYNRYLERMK